MKKGIWEKATGIGVALSLVLLIFAVLTPSTSAVNLSPGVPNNSSVMTGTTIVFNDVNFIIRSSEAIPVKDLTFAIFDTKNHQVADVHFSLDGTVISETPKHAFTVVALTDTSNLPHQSGGSYYGLDERTGHNITGFHKGLGYGYGYGNPDLVIAYTITYRTCTPGTFYAKLFVKTQKYTYTSGHSIPFTVSPKPLLSIYVDIKPGYWPNSINPKDHGYLVVAVCGTNTFDVHTIDPKSLTLSLNGGKNIVKPLIWSYQDVATPWTGPDGGGHSAKGDGYLDLTLKFQCYQVIHVLKLFNYPGETLRLTLTGTLKKTMGSNPVSGHDYVQIANLYKK